MLEKNIITWNFPEKALEKQAFLNFILSFAKVFHHRILGYTYVSYNNILLIQVCFFFSKKKGGKKKWQWIPYRYKPRILTGKYAQQFIYKKWTKNVIKRYAIYLQLYITLLKNRLNNKKKIMKLYYWNKIFMMFFSGQTKSILKYFPKRYYKKFVNYLYSTSLFNKIYAIKIPIIFFLPFFLLKEEKTLSLLSITKKKYNILIYLGKRFQRLMRKKINVTKIFYKQNIKKNKFVCLKKTIAKINNLFSLSHQISINFFCFYIGIYKQFFFQILINLSVLENSLVSSFSLSIRQQLDNLQEHKKKIGKDISMLKNAEIKKAIPLCAKVPVYLKYNLLGNLLLEYWSQYNEKKINKFLYRRKFSPIFIRQHITKNILQNLHKTKKIPAVSFKIISLKSYLKKNNNIILKLKRIIFECRQYKRYFNISTFVYKIVIAVYFKSAYLLIDVLKELLTQTSWKPKLWKISIDFFKKICSMFQKRKKNIIISLRLTGKWRGSARTRTVLEKWGYFENINKKNLINKSIAVAFAKIRPGVMGLKLGIYWTI